MQALKGPLTELAEFEEINKNRMEHPGMLCISGCVNSQKTHMMYALSNGCPYTVIALSSDEKAKKLYEEYRFLRESTAYYPAKDLLFYQADIHGKQLVKARMEAIQLLMEEKEEPVTIITTFDAFMDKITPLEKLKASVMTLEDGGSYDMKALEKQLTLMGYEHSYQAENPGQYAVRGGILDIYPLTEEVPVRIEFWGDDVDSIRTFDAASQRSIEKLEKVVLYPADELDEKKVKKVSFLEYFAPDQTLVFLDEPARLLELGAQTEEEVEKAKELRSMQKAR